MYQFKPKSKTFKGNVTFKEFDQNGRSITNTIEMDFKRLTQRQMDVIFKAHRPQKDEDGNDIELDIEEKLHNQALQVQDLVSDWKATDEHGEPLAFTHENIVSKLDENPTMLAAIWTIAGAGISGEIARKNG